MRNLPRSMPALLTPFTRDGDLDLKAHAHNAARMWDLGLRGILVAGSTGEGPYLEPGERLLLTVGAREAAPRAFIVCGVHAETVRGAQRAIAEAADGGADAALVVTPTTLVRHRPDLIEAFFADVAASSPLPLMLYSVPKVMGVELDEQAAIDLSELDPVIGMKDSGGDPLRAGRITAAAAPGFALYAGATAAVTLSVGSGAFGAITASANYAPRLVRDTVIAAQRSVRSAEVLQARLSKVSSAVERFGVAAVKYAAARVGFKSGFLRRPLQPLPPDARTAVRRALREAGLV
jgi:dihydrodipicolinate synthase/N-acetylneuraminate lyase